MTDSLSKQTHAQRRREESKLAIRQRLRAGQYIRRLHEIAEVADKIEPAQVPGLRLKADTYFRLLNKCLPDLRAIEHSGTVGVNYDAAVVALLNGADVEYAITVEDGNPAGAGSLPN